MESPVALIAGSTSGIGEKCTEAFLKKGWKVIGISRNQEEIQKDGFWGFSANFVFPENAEYACQKASNKWGHIDAVIHCIGNINQNASIEEMEWSRWQETFNICLGSAFNLAKYTQADIKATSGSYVYIASVAAKKIYPGISDYCAAKSSLLSFTRSLASELAPFKARANTISPAVVNTKLFRKSPYTIQEASSWHPLQRIGDPREIADLAEYLSGPHSRWITGQDYIIDGGMLI